MVAFGRRKIDNKMMAELIYPNLPQQYRGANVFEAGRLAVQSEFRNKGLLFYMLCLPIIDECLRNNTSMITYTA
jgi:hypothetical protein